MLKLLAAIGLVAALSACEPAPTRGGEEPTDNCPPNAEFCAE